MAEPLTDAEHEALEALDYGEAWLDAGLLDLATLRAQYQRMQGGGTRKTARYRAETLVAWRKACGSLDAEQVDAFVTVMQSESDKKFVNAAIAELITASQLGPAELERLAHADAKLIEKHAPLIRRTVLARRLADGISDELLDQVIESKDAALQSPLLRDPRLTRKQAERVASRGANPTIRSNAEAWVKDKKAWR
ncbi:MAG: hypothetical protein JRH16_07035 [Deltaproteobacteria bacterium]|nr:hypothetical protein [Deltaproteobacteria bacterium]MBW2360615.1 hypothetical protein [Deltaproteobacteria bacterium]